MGVPPAGRPALDRQPYPSALENAAPLTDAPTGLHDGRAGARGGPEPEPGHGQSRGRARGIDSEGQGLHSKGKGKGSR